MTAKEKTPEVLQDNGGEVTDTEIPLSKGNVLNHRTRTTSTTATLTAPTPKVQAWLAAIPNVQRLPVTDILTAGFSKPERAYVVDYLVAQVAKADAARLTARTLIVPALVGSVVDAAEFHVVATAGKARNAFTVSPTDPERRELHAQSVEPVSDHPVHTAQIGDTWGACNEDGEQWSFEYVGRFRLVGTFEDADTEWTQHVIREVTR